jgi:hypothetical protein
MSNKLRTVNVKFWQDSFIEEINSSEKLLFLYLLTNPLTNILGVYEISIKRISYDTGLSKENIEKALKGFERAKKIFYIDGFIILKNFLKNQNLNDNMKKGALAIYKELPNNILSNNIEGFESLSNALKDFENMNMNMNIEYEEEKELNINEKQKIFFENQINNLKEENEKTIQYKNLVKFILGNNTTKNILSGVLKIKNQISFDEYLKLIEKGLTFEKICYNLYSIENSKEYQKKYSSIYLTFLNWNKRDIKK